MWPFGKKKKKPVKKVRKQKKKYPHPDSEHNFDKDLTDTEFFEIMEDD